MVSSGVLLLVLTVASYGQALSKQNVIDLQKAGVEESLIIAQVTKDGIAFDFSAIALLELKKAGVSDAVLKSLLSARVVETNTSPEPNPSSDTSQYRTLFAQGHFSLLADQLKIALDRNPGNTKLRSIFVITLLKMGLRPSAEGELRNLRSTQASLERDHYVKSIDTLFADLDRQADAKKRLLASLKAYNAIDAATAIDQLSASPLQRDVLRIYLALYQGKFAEASKLASIAKAPTFSEEERLGAFRAQIQEAKIQYSTLMKQVESYLYSDIATSTLCVMKSPRENQIPEPPPIQAYFEAVNRLASLAPLDERVIDLIFHSGFMTMQYKDFEGLGDRLLHIKGDIRIPFFSNDRYFYVVLDSNTKRLYTEPDNVHRFIVSFDWKAGFGYSRTKRNVQENHWSAKMVPFDLHWDEIQFIGQRLHVDAGNSYALKLEPTGLAPNYGLMTFLFCMDGESATRTATRNLGQYILHVISNDHVKSELLNPEVHSGGIGGAIAMAVVVSAGVGALEGPAQGRTTAGGLITAIQADAAQRNALEQSKYASWQTILLDQSFAFGDREVFLEIEKLVGLL
jgi:hypothetical protein